MIHDKKCEALLMPPDVNRAQLCHCRLREVLSERDNLRTMLLNERNENAAALEKAQAEREEWEAEIGRRAEVWKDRAERAEAEVAELTALLPGVTYMDPPDGGSVSVLDQFRRMAQDAERYRWLRRLDHFASVDALLDTIEYLTLDAAIDAARKS